ncbi:DgyrCDS3708 [Dimorphilus gyrociliatus]|uniref:Methenyltetrahydrofolate synthase domain-containing protein n=1 Tax=Dimorphilus gyrociliatus TaxID=2664684 RepID=A0A7I8VHC2_9ANNE|nr:DgyrCDS3708 [Dimorphilus gyrociliatus]
MASVEDGNVLLDAASKMGAEVSKQAIREKVWEHFESNDIAANPIPVKNRIPNFKTSAAACDKLAELEVFTKANIIKVNPDKPQQQIRFRTLECNKTLLVPTPRLARGLFNRIEPPANANKKVLRTCSSTIGLKHYKTQIGLDTNVKLDLLVVGSVAVSPTGVRIGKGEGFADLEYALLGTVGAITPETLIVTVVHESQVIDIPESLVQPHDFGVDMIVTPTQVIEVKPRKERPTPKIDWSILTVEKYRATGILKQLREKEKADGKDVKLVDQGEVDPDDEIITPEKKSIRRRNYENKENEGEQGNGEMKKRNRKVFKRRFLKKKGQRLEENENSNAQQGEDNEKKDIPKRKYQKRPRRRTDDKEMKDGKENKENKENSDAKKKNRQPMYAVWLGKISRDVRVSELKEQVRGRGVLPVHVVWRPQTRSAFLLLFEAAKAEEAVDKLDGLDVNGCKPIVEISRKTKQRLSEGEKEEKTQEVVVENEA